ncbi:MAG: hypothetical protein IPK52_23220 [Chloroflexi bacterium]|nr:hypothetical protein [Chloroflexota bacterium]
MHPAIAKRLLLSLSLICVSMLLSSTASAAFGYTQFPSGSFTATYLPTEGYLWNDLEATVPETPSLADPAHTCLGDLAVNTPGTYTVWFGFSVPAGSITLNTDGSNYNTIMTLYAYTPQVENLSMIACHDDKMSVLIEASEITAAVSAGRYIVQISSADTGTQANLDLLLYGYFTADTPAPANDERTGAGFAPILAANNKPLKTLNAEAATHDSYAAVISAMNGCTMNNAVWYTYTPLFDGYYNFSTADSVLYTGNNELYTDTVLTVFRPGTGTFPVPCADGPNFASVYSQPLLGGNTYQIAVGMFNARNLLPSSYYSLRVSTTEIAGSVDNPMVVNGGFEIGDVTGWQAKNHAGLDGVSILTPISGTYSMVISAQAGVSKSLSTGVTLPGTGGFVPQKGGRMVASFIYQTTGTVSGSVALIVQYSDRAPVTVKHKLVSNSVGIVSTDIAAAITAKTVTKVTIKVKVKGGSGTLIFDDAALAYFGPAARTVSGVLPLPAAR